MLFAAQCFLMIFIWLEPAFAQRQGPQYEQGTHQYLVRQAWELVKLQHPEVISHDMNNHIGTSEAVPQWGGKVVIGAFQEDVDDIVYLNDYPNETSTHFWDADAGDNSKINIFPFGDFQNAYMKARAFMYNFDGETGRAILINYSGGDGDFIFYGSLFDFYRTGNYYIVARWRPGQLPPIVPVNPPILVHCDQETRDNYVYVILGHVAHLLGDMAVPAHSHNDTHVPNVDDDFYENCATPAFCQLWDFNVALSAGGTIDVMSKTTPLAYLFYTTNQIAAHFPSGLPPLCDAFGNDGRDPWHAGDYHYEMEALFSTMGGIPNCASLFNPVPMGGTLIPLSIRSIAGLLYWFYTEVTPITVRIGPATSAEGVAPPQGSFKYNGSIVDPNTWSVSVPRRTPFTLEVTPPGGWYFYRWNDNQADNFLNVRTITPAVSGTSIAYSTQFKKQLGTGNPNAFVHTGQRRFIEGGAGDMHVVYESGGGIWWERCVSNINWHLGSPGPLNQAQAKNPSIDFINENHVAIAFQERRANGFYDIVIMVMFLGTPIAPDNGVAVHRIPVDRPYSEDANPVVSAGWGTNEYPRKLMVVWKDNARGLCLNYASVLSTGLVGEQNIPRYGLSWFNGINWSQVIQGASPNATGHSLATNKYLWNNSFPHFHLAFLDQTSGGSNAYYCNLIQSGGTDAPSRENTRSAKGVVPVVTITQSSIVNVSQNTYAPVARSVSIAGLYDNSARIAYVGDVGYNQFTVIRNPSNLGFSQMLGQLVGNVAIDEYLGNYYCVFWTEDHGARNMFSENYDANPPQILPTTGEWIQSVSGGSSLSLDSHVGPPYAFQFWSSWIDAPGKLNAVVESKKATPFSLDQNYPNPFNPVTTISYQIPVAARVTLTVFDVLGREVQTLVDGQYQSEGSHTILFDGSTLTSGIYFCRLTAGANVATKKVQLIK